jgi:Lar family restriction alleviation protein
MMETHARKIVEVYRQAIADSAQARKNGEIADQALFESAAAALFKAYPHEIHGGGEPVERIPVETPLLPCPFCGGAAEFVRVGTLRRSCIVGCIDCGARLETGEVAAAGQRWNARKPLERQAKLLRKKTV